MKSTIQTSKSMKTSHAILLVVAVAAIAASAGALNGGTAPTASAWDGLQTWFTGMLSSTWVLVMALIVLVGSVWQLAHGGGYRNLSLVLGVLAVALIGPGFVTTIATSTLPAASITAPTALAVVQSQK